MLLHLDHYNHLCLDQYSNVWSGQPSIYRGKFYTVTYPASTDIITIVTQICSLSEKETTITLKSPIGQFPFVLSIDVVMHLVSHINLRTLFQTRS